MLTQAQLKQYLDYDPETGLFTWKCKKQGVKTGEIAGNINTDGYVRIVINYKPYAAHRLAWLYMYNKWPCNQLDHINRIKKDNRLVNLREVTAIQNSWNTGSKTNNISGYIGVHWDITRKKYLARIRINKKLKYLGIFNCPKEAHKAYITAKAKFHVI